MKVLVWKTFEEQARGLQHLPKIDRGTLYVFPYIVPQDGFHSRNVPEPFDLAFLSEDMRVLDLRTLFPPHDVAGAPAGTFMAVEAAAGNLARWGFAPGRRVSF